MKEPPRILIISHESFGDSPARSVTARGFRVAKAHNSESALAKLVGSHFDLLMINLSTISDPVELIRHVRSVATLNGLPILVFGEWGSGLPSLSLACGADAYEPATSPEGLIESVERLLKPRAVAAGAGE